MTTVRFYCGLMNPQDLVPTEDIGRKHWDKPSGRDYLDQVKRDIGRYGLLTPIDVDYDKRGRDRKPRPYIGQGHHRHRSAIELGLPGVEVSIASWCGVPPGLRNVREITREEHHRHLNGHRWGADLAD